MNFSWDENKAASNLEKHGISFDEAMLVFADPFLLMNQDRIENGEMRWQSIGEIEGIAVILVAHTWFDDDDRRDFFTLRRRIDGVIGYAEKKIRQLEKPTPLSPS